MKALMNSAAVSHAAFHRGGRVVLGLVLGDNTSTKLPSRAKYAVPHSYPLTITITIVAKQHEEQMTSIHHLFSLICMKSPYCCTYLLTENAETSDTKHLAAMTL